MNKYTIKIVVIVSIIVCESTFSYTQNIGVNTTGASPAITNLFEVLQPSALNNSVGIYVGHTGTPTTGYALQAIKSGAGVNNIAAYLEATGGTTNYSLIIPTGGGNAGIGTSTPTHQLTVKGALGNSGIFNIQGVGTGQELVAGVWYGGNATSWIQGSPLTLNPAGGNVGIGITVPTAKLHVDGGNIRLAATAGEIPFQLLSYSNSSSLWLTSGNASTSQIVLSPNYALDNDRGLYLSYTPGTTGSAAGIFTIGQIYKNNANWTHGITAFYTSGTERMRIIADGNVGIGTTTPSSKFEITNNGTGGGGIQAAGEHFNINAFAPNITLTDVSAGVDAFALHLNQNVFTIGRYTGSTAVTNDLVISGGNTGIGTSAPGYKLDVVGTAHVDGLNVNGAYSLPTADGTSNYVLKTNGSGTVAWADANSLVSGDNLGNHTATTTLNMNGNDIDMVNGQSTRIHSLGEISFDWTVAGTYDTPQFHGIQSKDEAGNWGDEIRINSYNDIITTLDANNNDGTSYFKVQEHSSTDGNDLFWVSSPTGNGYFSGNLGIGITPPLTKLHAEGTQIASFTGSTRGILSLSAPYIAGNYTPIDFMYTTNSVPTARIAAYHDGGGSRLIFGTSNNYGTGITNTAMTINSDGNVGIGITAPARQLHTTGTIRFANYTNGTLQVDGSGNVSVGTGSSLFTAGTGLTWSGSTLNSVWTASGNDIYKNNSGNVGIGTSSPSSLLEVNGRVESGREGYVGTYNSSQVQGIWSIGSAYGIDMTANDFGTQYGITYAYTNAGTTTNKLPIAGWGHQILFTSNGTRNAAISLTSGHGYFAGNIAIGNTAPSEKLHVTGNARITGLGGSGTRMVVTDNNGVLSQQAIPTGDITDVVAGAGLVGGGSSGSVTLDVIGANGLSAAADNIIWGGTLTQSTFITQGANNVIFDKTSGNFQIRNGAGTYHFFVDAAGNTGLGTNTPTQKLYVVGNSLVTGNMYVGSTDAYFYRDAANRIATPDDFYVQASSGNTYLYSTNTYLGAGSGDAIHLRGNSFDWTSGGGGIINTSGNVGIGNTTPSYKLHITGKIKTDAINETSDIRLKKEIVSIPNALEKVQAIRGVNYYWKSEDFPEMKLETRLQMGVIAQEVEKIIPEVVETDNEGYKSVEYSKMVGVLIEAIKDLSKITEEQTQLIESMKAESSAIESKNNLLKSENSEMKKNIEVILHHLNIKAEK